jgi:hypothetical protein
MRGFSQNLAGKPALQVGQVFLPWPSQRLKQARQKLCWQGPCRSGVSVPCRCQQAFVLVRRVRQPHRCRGGSFVGRRCGCWRGQGFAAVLSCCGLWHA